MFPDTDAHRKLAALDDDALYDNRKALGIDSSVSKEDCRNVTQTLKNLANTVRMTYDPSTGGLGKYESIAPEQQEHPNWMVVDENNQDPTYKRLTQAQADATRKGLSRVGGELGQGKKKKKKGLGKSGKSVKKGASKAGKTTTKATSSATPIPSAVTDKIDWLMDQFSGSKNKGGKGGDVDANKTKSIADVIGEFVTKVSSDPELKDALSGALDQFVRSFEKPLQAPELTLGIALNLIKRMLNVALELPGLVQARLAAQLRAADRAALLQHRGRGRADARRGVACSGGMRRLALPLALIGLGCTRPPADIAEPTPEPAAPAPVFVEARPLECDGTLLAIIDGRGIDSAQFEHIYAMKERKYTDRGRDIQINAARRYCSSISDRLIYQELLALEAAKRGVEYDAEALAEREAAQGRGIKDWAVHLRRRGEDDDSLRGLYVAELRERALLELDGSLAVSDEEVLAEYEKMKPDFSRSTRR